MRGDGAGAAGGALVVVLLVSLLHSATLAAPPEPGQPWLQVRAGVAFADNIQVGQEFVGLTEEPAPMFGVGMYWRTRHFDLGGAVEHTVGSRFARLTDDAPLGSQTRVAAMARWRFVDRSWGATTIRAQVGYGLSVLSKELAFEIGRIGGLDLTPVDRLVHGVDVAIDLGVLAYLFEGGAALHLDLGLSAGIGQLSIAGPDVPLLRVRGLVVLGIEWAL